MNKEHNHVLEYIILVTGLLSVLVIFYLFRYNSLVLLITSGIGSLFYVLWGIIHHAIEGRLDKLVFLEYFLIGLFVFSLLFIVIAY